MQCKYCKKDFDPTPYRPSTDGFCSWECAKAKRQLEALASCGVAVKGDAPIPPENLPLTDRQEEFCQLTVQYGSYMKAYKEVFGDERAEMRARALITAPFIQRRLKELRREFLTHLEDNKDAILSTLLTIATVNYLDVDTGGEIPRELGVAIKRRVRKFDKDGNLVEDSIELYDKLKAVHTLAKIGKLLSDKVDVDVKVTHTIAEKVKTYGDDDLVAKLVQSEIEEARLLVDKKDAIDVEVDDE